MKTGSASKAIWIIVVILAVSSIFAAAFALSTQVVGVLFGSASVLAIIDLVIFAGQRRV